MQATGTVEVNVISMCSPSITVYSYFSGYKAKRKIYKIQQSNK